MRLIRLTVDEYGWGYKADDIVEYKFFCELTKQEKEGSVDTEALYDDKNVFVKVKTTENPNIWGYMRDCEFEFIKTEDTAMRYVTEKNELQRYVRNAFK